MTAITYGMENIPNTSVTTFSAFSGTNDLTSNSCFFVYYGRLELEGRMLIVKPINIENEESYLSAQEINDKKLLCTINQTANGLILRGALEFSKMLSKTGVMLVVQSNNKFEKIGALSKSIEVNDKGFELLEIPYVLMFVKSVRVHFEKALSTNQAQSSNQAVAVK